MPVVCCLAVLALPLAAIRAGAEEPSAAPISQEAQALIQQLDAKDVFIRQMAFMQLEALREPSTAPIVRRYLTDASADTRAFCVRAVAAVERAAAIPTLIDVLHHDRDYRVRLAALVAMEPFEDPAVARAIIEALKDHHPYVRMAAVDAASRLEAAPAHEALLMRWHRGEYHRDVRRVLRDALLRIGVKAS